MEFHEGRGGEFAIELLGYFVMPVGGRSGHVARRVRAVPLSPMPVGNVRRVADSSCLYRILYNARRDDDDPIAGFFSRAWIGRACCKTCDSCSMIFGRRGVVARVAP